MSIGDIEMLRQKQIRNYNFSTLANLDAATLQTGELAFVDETQEWYYQSSAGLQKVAHKTNFPVEDSIDFTTSEPNVPVFGETYINTVSGTSSVTAQSVTANFIYMWNGTDWTEQTVDDGDVVYNKNTDELLIYNSTSWVAVSGGSMIPERTVLRITDIDTEPAGDYVGQLLWVSRFGAMYRWNGASWQAIGKGSADAARFNVLPIFTSPTTTNLSLTDGATTLLVNLTGGTLNLDLQRILNSHSPTSENFGDTYNLVFNTNGNPTIVSFESGFYYDQNGYELGEVDVNNFTLTNNVLFMRFQANINNSSELVLHLIGGPVRVKPIASFNFLYQGVGTILQTITSGSINDVQLDASDEVYTRNVDFDDGANTITINQSGIYRISFGVTAYSGAGAWEQVISINRNAVAISSVKHESGLSEENSTHTEWIGELVAGDVITGSVQAVSSTQDILGMHFNLESL